MNRQYKMRNPPPLNTATCKKCNEKRSVEDFPAEEKAIVKNVCRYCLNKSISANTNKKDRFVRLRAIEVSHKLDDLRDEKELKEVWE